MDRLPVAVPSISEKEERYVADAVRSTWISSIGPYIERFESEFAALCGTRAAVAASNGTVALHLALVALDLRPGDEVIVPSLTYVATANAVHYTGGVPVFVDVDAATWCLDVAAVEAAVTPRTKGVIAVHLYGHPADMDALRAVTSRHGLWIVEDAAEAHGAHYRGRPTGSLGDVGVFSFYGNKIVTSGEGGALTVSDEKLEARIRLLRGQGMDPQRRYFFPVVGYNYRLTNVAAAILCAQLERMSEIVAARRHVFEGYSERLADVPGIGFQPRAAWAVPAPWLFCVTVDSLAFGRSRDELASALGEVGIDTRPFFYPVHDLPPYRGLGTADLPVTQKLAATGLNLPTFVGLSDADLDRVALAIKAVHQRAAR